MVKKLTTPLTYFGGKASLADFIVNKMPAHEVYVELCGGGAAVLIAKGRAPLTEVYNDIGWVANFFKALRDHPEDLYRKLVYSPWSREEFDTCVATWKEEDDPVEKARKWFCVINQGFTHQESCKSWLIPGGVNAAEAFANKVDMLPVVAERFRKVIIENRSYDEIVEQYDAPNVLFYADPPYTEDSRTGGGYEHEMTQEDHLKLIMMLSEAKGQAMISGYANPLYDIMLEDWDKATKTRRSAIHNKNAKDVGDRTECLWIKRHANKGSLWQVGDGKEKAPSPRTNVPSVHSKGYIQPEFDLFGGE